MSDARPQIVRLITAILCSVGACWFTLIYSHFSKIRFEVDHLGGRLTAVNEMLIVHGQWLFVFPGIAALIGAWMLLRWRKVTVAFETLLSIVWLVSFAIAGLSLITWQIQNIPTLSGMELRY